MPSYQVRINKTAEICNGVGKNKKLCTFKTIGNRTAVL